MATIITTLYNGKVEMKFDSYWHKYTVDDVENGIVGKPALSVTKGLGIIAKPQLMYWAVNMAVASFKDSVQPGKSYDELELAKILETAKRAHQHKKSDAGDAGTLLHNWVEDFINKENPKIPVNKMLRESVRKFLKWTVDNKVEFLLAEQPVYSRKYCYAGTLDFICKMNGKLYIGDLKTSKAVYLGQKLQTAAYRGARVEEYPDEEYAGQLIVRIGKDGSFETVVLEDDNLYRKMLNTFIYFLKGGELYRSMEERR